jgi:trans-feruloyl-CoA hydratase/vanillin synthase
MGKELYNGSETIVVGDKSTDYKTIKIEREADGIVFLILNRPEKRNAMSPELHREMREALEELELDDSAKIVVLTGAGEAFSAGQDIKLYFRSTEDDPKARARAAMTVTPGAGTSSRNIPDPPSRW